MKSYTVTQMLECDQNATNLIVDNANAINSNDCHNVMKIRTKWACPQFNYYSFWNNIISNRFIIGPILILLGGLVCFLGIKFLYAMQILSGILVFVFVVCFLMFSYLSISYASWTFWIIVGISAILGGLFGWFIAQKVKWLASAIFGGFLGYVGGVFLYHVMLKYIKSNPIAVFWLIVLICITVGVILSIWLSTHIMIISTSFVGAYALIRGVSFMAGGFPDERQVMELVSNKEWEQVSDMLNYKVYLYLAFFLIVGVAGMIIQYKYFYNDKKEAFKDTEPHKDDEAKKNLLAHEKK